MISTVADTCHEPALQTRINGGTNISLAISKAGQLLKAADAEVLQASLADPAAPAAEPFPSKVKRRALRP